MRPGARRALAAVSLVNLAFFRPWAALLTQIPGYLRSAPAYPREYLGLMALILLLSGFVLAAFAVARRLPGRWARTLPLAGAFLLAAWGVASVYAEARAILAPFGMEPAAVALAFALAIAVVALLPQRNAILRRAPTILMTWCLLTAPVAGLFFAQGAYRAATTDREPAEPLDGSPVLPTSTGPRLMVILFDEFDYVQAFEEPPDGLALPAFDELRGSSLSASMAYAPHGETILSVPAITTGRFVESAAAQGHSDLELRWQGGGDAGRWSTTRNLFGVAKEDGLKVGIVGTYHPYCRVFARVVDACAVHGFERPEAPRWRDLATDYAVRAFIGIVPGFPLEGRVLALTGLADPWARIAQREEARRYGHLHDDALALAGRADLDLVFLHYFLPHPVGGWGFSRGYYRGDTQQLGALPDSTYYDNLVLADRTLGQLRTRVAESGLAARTHYLVIADHGYRSMFWGQPSSARWDMTGLAAPTEHRVPFIYHDPANPSPVLYESPFNVVATLGLARAAWTGTLGGPAGAALWLDGQETSEPRGFY